MFRMCYYLAPLAVAVVALVVDELRQRRAQARYVGRLFGHTVEQVAPRVLAAATFVAGIVLLFSGATPALPERLMLLDRVLPIGIVEASHFAGSVAGGV